MLIQNENIEILDLNFKNLSEIPSEVFSLKNLKKLLLYGNKLEVLPKEINKLKNIST